MTLVLTIAFVWAFFKFHEVRLMCVLLVIAAIGAGFYNVHKETAVAGPQSWGLVDLGSVDGRAEFSVPPPSTEDDEEDPVPHDGMLDVEDER